MRLITRLMLTAGCALLLNACSPQFDWREVRGNDAPFSILMPGKPASMSKPVVLAGLPLTMQMTAAEAGGISFAIGTLKLDDAGQAGKVSEAMKQGMLRNIQAAATTDSHIPGDVLQIHGRLGNGEPVLMAARFVIQGERIYQIIALGPEKKLNQDLIDTFMRSFRTN